MPRTQEERGRLSRDRERGECGSRLEYQATRGIAPYTQRGRLQNMETSSLFFVAAVGFRPARFPRSGNG